MERYKDICLMTIFRRTFNLINDKVFEHCELTAYLVYKMYEYEGLTDKNELIDKMFIALFHDIGAFKTNELDLRTKDFSTFAYEVATSVEHSIYGYLFMKNFSPFVKYSDAVLYHHHSYTDLMESDCKNKELAARICVADRLAVIFANGSVKIDENLFSAYRDRIFSGEAIDLLIKIQNEIDLNSIITNREYELEFSDICTNSFLDPVVIEECFSLIAYSIDFKSEYTVMHTITIVQIATYLARLSGLYDDVDDIRLAAYIHDIGKIATSHLVLEKTSKLDDYEYSIIKDHIPIGEYILRDAVSDKIFNIAMRHHEKLNGKGYPHGLTEEDLTEPEMILAVADVLSALAGIRSYKESFSEEKIRSILIDIRDRGEMSAKVINLVLEKYSELMDYTMATCKQAINKYQNLNVEYENFINRWKSEVK